ncbi:hypothetical protein H1R20_g12522, partial [Candolleomyces eurysporus]
MSKYADPFLFTRLLSLEVLEQEILSLRDEQQLLSQSPVPPTASALKKAWASIHKAALTLDADTLGSGAIGAVQTIMTEGPQAMNDVVRRSSALRHDRATLIKACSRLHLWVDKDVRSQAESVVHGVYEGDDDCWLARLSDDVMHMMVARVEEREFHPSAYGLAWDVDEVVVTNPFHRRYMSRTDEGTKKAVVCTVVNVVRGWLELDGYVKTRKAWFASAVEAVLGEEAISMDYVWRMYLRFKPTHVIEGDSAGREATFDDMQPFLERLRSHRVNDENSREGRMFAIYKQLARQEIDPGTVVRYLPAVSARWGAFRGMIVHAINYESGTLSTPEHRFITRLKASPEMLHPFRERTPGRIRSIADIYGGGATTSVSTVFSGMVWRGLTRGASVTIEGGTKFNSLQEALDAIKRCVKDSKLMETMTQCARVYWKHLEQRRWPAFAASKPTFEECYQHLRPTGPFEHKLYPRLGKAGTFDLAGDLAYAGVCEWPDWSDVARHIVQMNAGSMKALRDLGLLDGSKNGVEEKRLQVQQALRDIHHLVEDVLEEELGDRIALRPIELEHMIRTFSSVSAYME